MTDKEIDRYIRDMKDFSKKTSSSNQKTRKFLEKTGIYTRSGNLTTHYKEKKNTD